MKKIKVSIGVLALTLLAACGASGQVTDKSYSPGYTIYQTVSCGKGCFTVVPTYFPPCYGVTVTGGHSACIDEQTWNKLHVGDYYSDKSS